MSSEAYRTVLRNRDPARVIQTLDFNSCEGKRDATLTWMCRMAGWISGPTTDRQLTEEGRRQLIILKLKGTW